MNAELIDYGTGSYGLQVALRTEEIDEFIELLELLKKGESDFDHFHMARAAAKDGKVYDIEFSVDDEAGDMVFL